MSTRAADQDRIYKAIIDRLVDACRTGQGQVGARRARAGVWNANANTGRLPDQHDINLFLARIPTADRETLARMLEQAFVSGVHATLVTLHEATLPPFDKAYEGTPFPRLRRPTRHMGVAERRHALVTLEMTRFVQDSLQS